MISLLVSFRPRPIMFVSIGAVVVLLAGGGFAAFESRQVSSYGEGVWWALSLMSTVGFVGEAPESTAGRLVSSVLMVTGFALMALVTAFHQAAPSVPLGLITEDGTGAVPTGQDTWLRTVNQATGSVTDAGVDGAQARHLKVFAWPLDPSQSSAAQVERLVDDGVDGIITDNPILVRHEIDAAGATTT